MASFLARRAFSTSFRRLAEADKTSTQMQRDTKRNPELYILGGVMLAALTGAGFYLGRSPTSNTSEAPVKLAKDSMPWEIETAGKYKFHPQGNADIDPQEAPSAVQSVVVPDVNLPKHLHDKWNKWGKDDY